MNEIYYKKREYEKLISDLYIIYDKLDDAYSKLLACKKKIEICVTINDDIYLRECFDQIIEKVNNYKQRINDYYIPNVKENYNKLLLQLNQM